MTAAMAVGLQETLPGGETMIAEPAHDLPVVSVQVVLRTGSARVLYGFGDLRGFVERGNHCRNAHQPRIRMMARSRRAARGVKRRRLAASPSRPHTEACVG